MLHALRDLNIQNANQSLHKDVKTTTKQYVSDLLIKNDTNHMYTQNSENGTENAYIWTAAFQVQMCWSKLQHASPHATDQCTSHNALLPSY